MDPRLSLLSAELIKAHETEGSLSCSQKAEGEEERKLKRFFFSGGFLSLVEREINVENRNIFN